MVSLVNFLYFLRKSFLLFSTILRRCKLKWLSLRSYWFRGLWVNRWLFDFTTRLLSIVSSSLNNNILSYFTLHSYFLSYIKCHKFLFSWLQFFRLFSIISCTTLNTATRVSVLILLCKHKWWHCNCFLLHWLIWWFDSLEDKWSIRWLSTLVYLIYNKVLSILKSNFFRLLRK